MKNEIILNNKMVFFDDEYPIIYEAFKVIETIGIEIDYAYASSYDNIYIFRENKRSIKRILSKYFEVLNVSYNKVGGFTTSDDKFIDTDKTYHYILKFKDVK